QFGQKPQGMIYPAMPYGNQLKHLPEIPDGNLIDPITSKELKIDHVPVDKILEYNWLDNRAYEAKTLLVTLPKTILKGLRGDSDFSFSDFMLLSKVPYYLGGLFLTLSFVAGRSKPMAVKQGLGVGLYYLGVMAANTAINSIYQLRYGVDLDQKYRRADGRIEKVFASADFPRFDLLTPQQYRHMEEKMGIPTTITDPDQACREQLFRVISSSRSMKLLLGNLFAAVGAGYIARSDAWIRLLGNQQTFKHIWMDPKAGNILTKISSSLTALKSLVFKAVEEKTFGHPSQSSSWLHKASLASLAGVMGLCLFESMRVVKHKEYQSSPITLLPRGENWNRHAENSVFKQFQLMQEGGSPR
ncbi:MAG: hypothetical protein K2X66_15690, partial [Cyanobacteria bacterium]|nr:hypothetical protein [Cyanobacteriota bacterium]